MIWLPALLGFCAPRVRLLHLLLPPSLSEITGPFLKDALLLFVNQGENENEKHEQKTHERRKSGCGFEAELLWFLFLAFCPSALVVFAAL